VTGGTSGIGRALAFELEAFKIRVNTIAPSHVRSDIWTARGLAPEIYNRMLAAKAPNIRSAAPENRRTFRKSSASWNPTRQAGLPAR
jgi:NAD(P)-dependent dehydrogenase (short-subunit alcohol dehydrogenase family)